MITFKCRECGKRLFVKRELAGRRVQCPRCFKYLAVPEPTFRNLHLRGITMTFLAGVIVLAVGWMVYFVRNGGLQG